MHFWTTPEEEEGCPSGFYNDAMVGHDNLVGRLLDQLDVSVSRITPSQEAPTTDRINTWPDAAITPFSEKNTNWRVASECSHDSLPGKIPAGTILNDMMSHKTGAHAYDCGGRPTVTVS